MEPTTKHELHKIATDCLLDVLQDKRVITHLMQLLRSKVVGYSEVLESQNKVVGTRVILPKKGDNKYDWMTATEIVKKLKMDIPPNILGKELSRNGGIRKYVNGIACWRIKKIKKSNKVQEKPKVVIKADADYIVNNFIVLATSDDGQWKDVTAEKLIHIMGLKDVGNRSLGIALTKAGALKMKKNNLSYFRVKKMKTKKYQKFIANNFA